MNIRANTLHKKMKHKKPKRRRKQMPARKPKPQTRTETGMPFRLVPTSNDKVARVEIKLAEGWTWIGCLIPSAVFGHMVLQLEETMPDDSGQVGIIQRSAYWRFPIRRQGEDDTQDLALVRETGRMLAKVISGEGSPELHIVQHPNELAGYLEAIPAQPKPDHIGPWADLSDQSEGETVTLKHEIPADL